MFLGGRVAPIPGSREFLVIIEGTPAEHRDAEKVAKLLRAGHHISLRVREESDQSPILISDITDDGWFIIRCKNLEEADHVIDRLRAGPINR